MPLSQRPWSVNSHALPVVWYRCHCIDMRESDFSRMTSVVKSWVYADCLEKPEELVTHQSRAEGGLGLHHIKSKSIAILIKSFIETALGSKFVQNIYHNALYKWHVLLETNIENPGSPPYYSSSFFSIIREVHSEGRNIVKMTSKDWYKVVIERNIQTVIDGTGERVVKRMKVEKRHPDVDWSRSWNLLNSKGINSEQTSMMFRILHNLLPTRTRLFRMGLTDSPVCLLCPHGIAEDLPHALLECSGNSAVNDWVIAVLFDIDPGLLDYELSGTNLVTLNIGVENDMKLPVVCFLSLAFGFIWKRRRTMKTMTIFDIKTSIQAEVHILKKTKHRNAAEIIDSALNFTL